MQLKYRGEEINKSHKPNHVNVINSTRNLHRETQTHKHMHEKQQKQTRTTAVMVNTQCQRINSVNSYCWRFGHIEWVCIKKKRNRNKDCNNFLFPNVEKFYFEEKHYKVIRGTTCTHYKHFPHKISSWTTNNSESKYYQGKVFKMEVDTGTILSVISESDYSAIYDL